MTFINATTINITILSDQLAEGLEQFRLLLRLPSPGVGSRITISTPVATVTILDETSECLCECVHYLTQCFCWFTCIGTTIQYSSPHYTTMEGGGEVVTILEVIGELNNTISVLLTTRNGSAAGLLSMPV